MSLFTFFSSSRASGGANSNNGGEHLVRLATALRKGENPADLLKTMQSDGFWHISSISQIENLTSEEAHNLILDVLNAKRREMSFDPGGKVEEDYEIISWEEAVPCATLNERVSDSLTRARTGFSQSVKKGFAWAVGSIMSTTFPKAPLTPRRTCSPQKIELDKLG